MSARLIDRPIRPLFPDGYMYDTHVHATVLSVDQENDPDIAAAIGTSTALSISNIPFNGPIGSARVGRIDGKLTINPSTEQKKESDLSMLVAASSDAVVMVEGECHELSESDVKDAIMFAFKEIQKVIGMQKELQSTVGRETRSFEVQPNDDEVKRQVADYIMPKT